MGFCGLVRVIKVSGTERKGTLALSMPCLSSGNRRYQPCILSSHANYEFSPFVCFRDLPQTSSRSKDYIMKVTPTRSCAAPCQARRAQLRCSQKSASFLVFSFS